VAAVGHAVDRQPLHFRRQDRERGGRGRDLHLTGREDIAAVRALPP
jgi:hypothetical protein